MEKIIFALHGVDHNAAVKQLPDALKGAGAQFIRINVRDEAVAAGEGLIQSREVDGLKGALPEAVVQLWLPSSHVLYRQAVDRVIADHCQSFEAWLVSESNIITNDRHVPEPGARTSGFAQIAFLTLPEKLHWNMWRAIWRDDHTAVAIETQSNFEYVQNLVVEPLTDQASPFVAIVEECFPLAALTDPLVFFDAAGDANKFEKNLARMMESCGRFIDPGTINVFPTSQYDMG